MITFTFRWACGVLKVDLSSLSTPVLAQAFTFTQDLSCNKLWKSHVKWYQVFQWICYAKRIASSRSYVALMQHALMNAFFHVKPSCFREAGAKWRKWTLCYFCLRQSGNILSLSAGCHWSTVITYCTTMWRWDQEDSARKAWERESWICWDQGCNDRHISRFGTVRYSSLLIRYFFDVTKLQLRLLNYANFYYTAFTLRVQST